MVEVVEVVLLGSMMSSSKYLEPTIEPAWVANAIESKTSGKTLIKAETPVVEVIYVQQGLGGFHKRAFQEKC